MSRFGVIFLLLLLPIVAWGQERESYRDFLRPEIKSPKLAGPQHFRDHVVEGKLRLSLHDAIILTLENNSNVHVQEAQVEDAKFSVLRSFRPFDPQLQTVFRGQRTAYPGFSQVQGAGTFNDLNQSAQINYLQAFETGTNITVGLNSTKDSSNSGFYFLNPYYQSFLNLQITQPLLRNAWRFPNQAPILIARTNLQQSRLSFEAQVNTLMLQAITRYWAVVSAHN
ncbi:MAG TPA: TolC family protein, partial [Terriglobales bacterium]